MQRRTLARSVIPLLLTAVAFSGPGCGGDGDSGPQRTFSTHVYEFPADLPFDASEWTTNTDYEPLGSPNAKRDMQDRPFTMPVQEFPATLRRQGPNANTSTNATLHSLQYETLVGLHPETEEYTPGLASHWKVETDEETGIQTFWFRIDERAKFADGKPVTAADVHATWWHRTQEDRTDPMGMMTYQENYEEPVILDRRTVMVKTKERNWRLFLYFGAGMLIYPANECRIPGKAFLEEQNWLYMTGSGPYHLASDKDIKKGDSITLTRREDWWGWDDPMNKGVYNFKKIKLLVVRERELIYQKFKVGELDWYPVSKAQRWVEEVPKEDAVEKGWVQARRIFNQMPIGYSGFAFNTRKPPFDKKEVRLAFAHLFNREQLIEKLFFNQYQPIHSIFPGRDWGAGDEIDNIEFDPGRAQELLAEAGYKERDQDGFLIGPDGKRFEVTFEFFPQDWERIWLVVKPDIEAGGIKLDLKVVDGATLQKKITERQFTIHWQNWGSILFPNPETTWRSDLADLPANNNITSFKNARVDELCEEYNRVLDRKRQKEITREIDKLVCAEVPYAFGWYAGYMRILYWNRFGHPERYVTRITDQSNEAILAYWWWDEDKHNALEAAMAAGQPLEGELTAPIDVKPWASGDDE